jgi:hypothetical protein
MGRRGVAAALPRSGAMRADPSTAHSRSARGHEFELGSLALYQHLGTARFQSRSGKQVSRLALHASRPRSNECEERLLT